MRQTMNIRSKYFRTAVALGALLALTLSGAADAARLGGGRSFGSKPSYSAPYQRQAPSHPSATSTPRPATPSPAATHNQAARDALARRGGLTGMLGGLALGGLLGALFFGGAFEGINLLDFLLFGGLAFLAWKLLSSRRAPESVPAGMGGADVFRREAPPAREETFARREQPSSPAGPSTKLGAGFDTDVLFGRGKAPAPAFTPAAPAAFPAGFDADTFLEGAEAAYRQLQDAWNQGELAEIRGLATDKVFAEIQTQFRASGKDSYVEILELQAELLEVTDGATDREASVLFEALLREAPGAEPVRVQEVWRFIRSRASRQPTWFLDGIQQIEA
jgi:predicted lipid-binding transport protein (Tim44 family)